MSFLPNETSWRGALDGKKAERLEGARILKIGARSLWHLENSGSMTLLLWAGMLKRSPKPFVR
jgi:hypothetical protein